MPKTAANAAKAQAKAKIAAAKVKAKEKATRIIAAAKVKAAQIKWKAGHDAAKKTAAIKAGKVSDPKAARAASAAAKKAATAKAKAVMDSAKAKASAQSAAILSKAGVQAPVKPAVPAAAAHTPTPQPAPTPPSPQQSTRPMSDHDLEAARQRVMATATAQELGAAKLYSGASYQQINTSLRTGRFDDSGLDEARMNQAIGRLDSLMDKSKLIDPVITYRGSAPHPAFAGLKRGQVFVDKAFVSTTSDHDSIFANETFNGGVVFHITSPPGTKMAGIPSNYPEEKEMLLGRGTAFRLDREERGADPNGKPLRILHVTVVGQH